MQLCITSHSRPTMNRPMVLGYAPLGQHVTAVAGEQRATILIVDDSETIRTLLAQILNTANYTVLTAEHGVLALEVLETTPVDLVLLDVMMPVMDGLRTCTEIRKRWTIPIIFLSSIKDTSLTAHMYKLGANAYLPKASNPRDLLACIDSLLSLKV